MALEHAYDLVVLDVMLPGIDGWEIMRALRARRDLPVIFLTARDHVSDRIAVSNSAPTITSSNLSPSPN